jgi:DNA-binding response OmpR family regulator
MPIQRSVALLHVEDDPMQQRMVAHHLKAIPEHTFTITAVASEELALECFQKTKIDFVLLDYQLVQGNGMHLLGCLRALDPIVPIIAISGVATSEIAAELVLAGADDYFNKRDLNSVGLAASVRSSLRRADTVRKKLTGRPITEMNRITPHLAKFYAEYAGKLGADFLAPLDVIAKEIKHACLTPEELRQVHEDAALQMNVEAGPEQTRANLIVRPMLLELLVRVFERA